MMRLPDFIIIGAAKSGTTTLYQQLRRHPDIFMSDPKEPTYFARDERFYRGIEWYASLFQTASTNQICGEASTNYTNITEYPETITRMKALLPEIKMIYIMRHPVDRAYSHYKQLISNKRYENPDYKIEHSFEEHIKKDRSVIDSSNYMLQIEAYLQHYRKDQFLFLFDDDLRKDLEETLNHVCDFLFVPLGDFVTKEYVKTNVSIEKEEWLIREKLLHPLRNIPGYETINKILPQTAKEFILSIMKKSPQKKQLERDYIAPPMLEHTRRELLNYFSEPNQKLQDFLNRKIPNWWI